MVTCPATLLLWALIVVFLAFWIPALFAPMKLMSALQKIMKNEEMLRLWGFFVFIIALLFFMVHYMFHGAWYIIFSILGILSLIKWFALVWYPKFSEMWGKIFYSQKILTMIVGIFLVLLSVYFVFIALK